MSNGLSVQDGIALLERSNLPTVLTEGSSDYRVMRRLEARLADCGLDFLPMGGRNTVLGAWEGLSEERRRSLVALVDLDTWVLFGIPDKYQHRSLLYTQGYSIENDIFMDSDLLRLCSSTEEDSFYNNLDFVCSYHARELTKLQQGKSYELKTKVHKVLTLQDIGDQLDDEENTLKTIIKENFGQILRGKTLFELLSIELSRPGRHVSFGYDHLYEIGASSLGKIFDNLEYDIRSRIG